MIKYVFIFRFFFLSTQNKEFVCRGHDYERLEAFQQRMLGEFPQAIAMQHPNQPDEGILQGESQCILHHNTMVAGPFNGKGISKWKVKVNGWFFLCFFIVYCI